MSVRPAFPETSWTLIVAARGGAPGACAELARRYYRPVHAFIAALVRDPTDADDLTQGFFERAFVMGRLVEQVDRERGHFRPFLMEAARNWVRDWWRRGQRGPRLVRPDAEPRGWQQIPEEATPPAEAVFHDAWVRALLDHALARVREVCAAKGQGVHLEIFLCRFASPTSRAPGWAELGAPHGLDEKAARNRAETVSRHFRLVLREMLVVETGSAEAADAEIEALLAGL
ncbi:MAG: sigma-70 family RNA polymerase sigma factor [Deltaproteobacteria bacterium]|nr:sigma-70 family RNA polymerase sigma factor [Deltaproteobacteria bacterium]